MDELSVFELSKFYCMVGHSDILLSPKSSGLLKTAFYVLNLSTAIILES